MKMILDADGTAFLRCTFTWSLWLNIAAECSTATPSIGCASYTCTDFGAQLIEMDGEDDHVHLLVEYPPKVAVSGLVNSLKGVSSVCCARSGQTSRNTTGMASCGHRPTSPHPVVVRQFPSCASTLNSSRHPTENQGRLRCPRYPSPP